MLAGLDHHAGCRSPIASRRFAETIARHGSRFAFPDEVEKTLRPFAERMKKRANKNSPEGRCVDSLEQVRAVARPSGGEPSGYSIELEFIVPTGELSAGTVSAELDPATLACVAEGAPGIAARLSALSPAADAEREFLWMALVREWASLAEPHFPVTSVSATVESEGEYTLTQYQTSVRLELDDLSQSGDS